MRKALNLAFGLRWCTSFSCKLLYIVNLSNVAANKLETLLSTGKSSYRMLTRARILLEAHEGQSEQAIAPILRVNLSTVERTREKYVCAESLETALKNRPYSNS